MKCSNCLNQVNDHGSCGYCGTQYVPKISGQEVLEGIYWEAFWIGAKNGLSHEVAHKDALLLVRTWDKMQAELAAAIEAELEKEIGNGKA
jgi:hypothetical protein